MVVIHYVHVTFSKVKPPFTSTFISKTNALERARAFSTLRKCFRHPLPCFYSTMGHFFLLGSQDQKGDLGLQLTEAHVSLRWGLMGRRRSANQMRPLEPKRGPTVWFGWWRFPFQMLTPTLLFQTTTVWLIPLAHSLKNSLTRHNTKSLLVAAMTCKKKPKWVGGRPDWDLQSHDLTAKLKALFLPSHNCINHTKQEQSTENLSKVSELHSNLKRTLFLIKKYNKINRYKHRGKQLQALSSFFLTNFQNL